MINNLDELLELVDVYHTWIKRALYALAIVSLFYGGYKYGFTTGFDKGAEAAVNYLKSQPDSKTSSLPSTDGQPGKMWEPEA